jgi:DNA polymerase III sliding clamp (beta) subunit (PCNA family)
MTSTLTRITVDAAALRNAVDNAPGASAGKTTDVKHAVIALEVSGGNMIVQSSSPDRHRLTSIPCEGDLPKVAVHGATFAEIIKSASGEVRIEVRTDPTSGNAKLKIASDGMSFSLATLDVDLLDAPVRPAGSPQVMVNAKTFASMIARAAKAASSDVARPVLTVMHVSAANGSLRVSTTDSYRVADMSTPCEGDLELDIVPGTADLVAASKGFVGDVTIQVDGTNVFIRSGTSMDVLRQIEGTYPEIDKILPSAFSTEVTVTDVSAFKRRLERLKPIAEPTSKQVAGGVMVTLTLTADGSTVEASGKEVGTGKGELDVEINGPDIEISFALDYLLNALDQNGGAALTLKFNDALKPLVIDGGTVDSITHQAVVMPKRAN